MIFQGDTYIMYIKYIVFFSIIQFMFKIELFYNFLSF